jgi:uncharacterized protein DUF5678
MDTEDLSGDDANPADWQVKDLRKSDYEGDRLWVRAHLDELSAYEGEYIAVVAARVVARGATIGEVTLRANEQGYSSPLRTRIEGGRNIDVYDIGSGSITIVERPESS